jgi:hypothetical protein
MLFSRIVLLNGCLMISKMKMSQDANSLLVPVIQQFYRFLGNCCATRKARKGRTAVRPYQPDFTE